jgi:hypothetical protein
MIAPATLLDLYYLAHNLRERDRQELAETREDMSPASIAIDAHASPWKWAAGSIGQPVMALGAKPAHAGVATVWGFGTNDYKSAIREMTDYAKAYMVPALIASGLHRAQCIVHPENRASQRWLTSLGFNQEAVLRGFGSSHQDMLLYAWVLDEPNT